MREAFRAAVKIARGEVSRETPPHPASPPSPPQKTAGEKGSRWKRLQDFTRERWGCSSSVPRVTTVVHAQNDASKNVRQPQRSRFSATRPSRQPRGQIFFQTSLLFPSESIRKSCGKSGRRFDRRSCAEDVEKTLSFCGFPIERLCKNLRITCENPADSSRRTLRNQVYILWT